MSEITAYLVWTGLKGKPETHQLRAIDSSQEIADRHKSMCEHEMDMRDEIGITWIEQRDMDHLYGYELWAALSHVKRLRGGNDGV